MQVSDIATLPTITTELFVSGVPYIEKMVRTLAVYLFLIVGLRIAGKRTLGALNSFDLVVLLLLSNTVQNAIIGNDTSLVGGLFGAGILIAANYGLVRFLYSHRKFDRALEGSATVLIRKGELQRSTLKRLLITFAELQSAARRQGIGKISDVRTAWLETGGAVSFELEPHADPDTHMADVISRLDRIEQQISALASSRQT